MLSLTSLIFESSQKLDDAVLTLSLLRSEAKGKDALAASLRKECDELRGVIDDHESKLEALEATLELESAECKRLVASLAAVGGAGGSGTPATRERAQVRAPGAASHPLSCAALTLALYPPLPSPPPMYAGSARGAASGPPRRGDDAAGALCSNAAQVQRHGGPTHG